MLRETSTAARLSRLVKEELFCHLLSGPEVLVPEPVDDAHQGEGRGHDDKALEQKASVYL